MFQCLNIKSNMLEHLVNVLCGKHKCSSNYTRRFGGCSVTFLSNFFAIFSRILFSYSFSSIPCSNLCQTSPSFSHLSSLCNTSGVTTSQFWTSCSFCFLALCAFFFCNSSFSVVLVPNARAYCLSLSLLLIQLVVSVHLVQSHQLSSVFHTYFSYSFFLKCCSENSVWSYFYST